MPYSLPSPLFLEYSSTIEVPGTPILEELYYSIKKREFGAILVFILTLTRRNPNLMSLWSLEKIQMEFVGIQLRPP